MRPNNKRRGLINDILRVQQYSIAFYYNYFNLGRCEHVIVHHLHKEQGESNREVNQILITLTPRCIQLILAPCEKFHTREIIKASLSQGVLSIIRVSSPPPPSTQPRGCTSSSSSLRKRLISWCKRLYTRADARGRSIGLFHPAIVPGALEASGGKQASRVSSQTMRLSRDLSPRAAACRQKWAGRERRCRDAISSIMCSDRPGISLLDAELHEELSSVVTVRRMSLTMGILLDAKWMLNLQIAGMDGGIFTYPEDFVKKKKRIFQFSTLKDCIPH